MDCRSGLPFRRFAVVDILLIAALLSVSAVWLPRMFTNRPAIVVVYLDSRIVARYPLDVEREVTVDGRIGRLHLRIAGGSVRVSESSCPHAICRRTGPVRYDGQQIVCAPNHLLIEIQSTRVVKERPDAVTP